MANSSSFYFASKKDVKSWVDGGGEFLRPERILADLSEEQATTVPTGSPYSIAQIVSHMHYYQGSRFAKERGESWPKAQHLDDTFAPVQPGGWKPLVTAFLRDLRSIKKLADQEAKYDYVSRSLHNAYHLGEIVVLRRILGLWPPEGGEPYDF